MDRDLAPDLANTRKSARQGLGVAAQHLFCWRCVVAGVNSYRAEQRKRGILLEHPRRSPFGAVVLVVHQPLPSRIVPCGRTEHHLSGNAPAELVEPMDVY